MQMKNRERKPVQGKPEFITNVVCLDRKFIAAQTVNPVEDVFQLFRTALTRKTITNEFKMMVFRDRLVMGKPTRGPQLPEIYFDDIVQIEAVSNADDTCFILCGKVNMGIYYFFWFIDSGAVENIKSLVQKVNGNSSLVYPVSKLHVVTKRLTSESENCALKKEKRSHRICQDHQQPNLPRNGTENGYHRCIEEYHRHHKYPIVKAESDSEEFDLKNVNRQPNIFVDVSNRSRIRSTKECQNPYPQEYRSQINSVPRRTRKTQQREFIPIVRPPAVARKSEIFESQLYRRPRPRSLAENTYQSGPDNGFQIINKQNMYPIANKYKSVVFEVDDEEPDDDDGDERFIDFEPASRRTTDPRMMNRRLSLSNQRDIVDQRIPSHKILIRGTTNQRANNQNGYNNDRQMRPDIIERDTIDYRRTADLKTLDHNGFNQRMPDQEIGNFRRLNQRRQGKYDVEDRRLNDYRTAQSDMMDGRPADRFLYNSDLMEARNRRTDFDFTYFEDQVNDKPIKLDPFSKNLRTISINGTAANKRRSISFPTMDMRNDNNSSSDSLYLESPPNPFEASKVVNFLPELRQKLRERQAR